MPGARTAQTTPATTYTFHSSCARLGIWLFNSRLNVAVPYAPPSMHVVVLKWGSRALAARHNVVLALEQAKCQLGPAVIPRHMLTIIALIIITVCNTSIILIIPIQSSNFRLKTVWLPKNRELENIFSNLRFFYIIKN